MNRAQKLSSLKEKMEAVLVIMSDDCKQKMIEWLEAEQNAYNDGTHDMPSYTHPDAGAEHAISAIISSIEDSI